MRRLVGLSISGMVPELYLEIHKSQDTPEPFSITPLNPQSKACYATKKS